jgi:hypothetical protein
MDNPDISDISDISEVKTEEDRKADARAVLVIFVALVLGAVHFVSGWTFDL